MKNKYYVIKVWGDVPSLHGPYDSEEERGQKAKELKKQDLEEEGDHYSGFYWLDSIDGVETIGSWSGSFFTEPPTPINKIDLIGGSMFYYSNEKYQESIKDDDVRVARVAYRKVFSIWYYIIGH